MLFVFYFSVFWAFLAYNDYKTLGIFGLDKGRDKGLEMVFGKEFGKVLDKAWNIS